VHFLAYRVAPAARGVELLLERVQACAQLLELLLGAAVGAGGDRQCQSRGDEQP
jgi:hypothetical protein